MNEKLYIFMRTDLDSMNPGKAMAQATHAGNMLESMVNFNDHQTFKSAFKNWKNQANGFGTTIVLDAAEYSDCLKSIGNFLIVNNHPSFGVVHDPSYPIRDGTKTHLIPLDTCAYLFDYGQIEGLQWLRLDLFKLHP